MTVAARSFHIQKITEALKIYNFFFNLKMPSFYYKEQWQKRKFGMKFGKISFAHGDGKQFFFTISSVFCFQESASLKQI